MARHGVDGGAAPKAKATPKAPGLAPTSKPLAPLKTPPKPARVKPTATQRRSPAHTGKSTVPPPKGQTVKQATARVPTSQITSKPNAEPPAPAPTRAGRAKQNRVALRARATVIAKTNDKHNPLVPKLVKAGYLTVGPNDPLGAFSKTEHHHVFKGPKLLSTVEKSLLAQSAKRGDLSAPAVKALEIVGRPAHAIAGATDALVKGKGLSGAHHAATRGIEGKSDSVGFGQVLKDAGVKSHFIRGAAGLGLDVLTDPTTYVTLGTGTLVKKTAEREAKAATEAALKRGASKKAADREGRAAASRAVANPKNQVKGVQVGVRMHVPFADKGIHPKTSGRVSSTIARKTGASKVGRAVRNSRAVQGAGRAFGYDFRPKEFEAGQHTTIRAALRRHRAEVSTAGSAAGRQQRALRKALPSDALGERKIVDVIESGKPLKSLGKDAPVARALRRSLGEAHDVKRASGVLEHPFRPTSTTDAQRFIPHVRRQDVEAGARKSVAGRIRVAKESGRTIREPLATVREHSPHLFTEDLSTVVPRHVKAAKEKASLSKLWQEVAKTGKPLTKHSTVSNLGDELVYKVTPHGLTPLVKEGGDKIDLDAIHKEIEHPTGKHVILNRQVVDDVQKQLSRGKSAEGVTRAYDKVTGALKTAYTVPNPSYHVRNFGGDTETAFKADTSARSFLQAAKILKTHAARNKFESSAASLTGGVAPARLEKTITIGNRHVTHDEIIRDAEREGVLPSSFTAGELKDLAGHEGGAFKRAAQYREWQPRLATYISALKRGMTSSEAAGYTLFHHIDYQDVTPFEKNVARRVIPFYTFFARNTRIQATKILTRPGKYATFGKVLNTAAQAAGYQSYEQYVGGLKDYKQRGLPVPIKVGGKVYDVQVGSPTMDLNQLTASPTALLQDVANRTTFYKLIFELPLNYSTFFQSQIQNPRAPRTPAPPWAATLINALPGPLRKEAVKITGLQKIVDPHTQKMTWGWLSKTDYALRSIPEGNLVLGATLGTTGSRGQTPGQQLLGWTTGAKVSAHTNNNTKLSNLGAQLGQLENRLGELAQAGKKYDPHGYATPEYQRVLDQIKSVKAQRVTLKAASGQVAAPRLKVRPLTIGQQIQREIKNAQRSSDPKTIQREIQREIEKAQGG